MLVIFFISLVTVLSSLVIKPLRNFFLTDPLIAMLVGFAMGPELLGIIHVDKTSEPHHILKLACEFTIAMALMSTALRVPKRFFLTEKKTISIIVILGMLLMWILSTTILYLVINLPLPLSILTGAVITPTDPVISSTIVSGKKSRKVPSGTGT